MSEKYSSSYYGDQQLLPAEEKLEVKKRNHKIIIGIPANANKDEYCLPLTPQAVEILVQAGHQVVVEAGAGNNARYSDLEYSEAGAIVASERIEVMQCDYILKVAPFTTDDIAMLRGNQVIFSMLHIDRHREDEIRKLMQKKVTSVAFEYLKDELGGLPVMQSLSEISGIVAMTVGSEHLSISKNGKGVLLGGVTGISPAEVLILGSGTAAHNAVSVALGLGADVKVFDNSVSLLRLFEANFNRKIFTSLYYPRVLEKAIMSADVVLGAQPFNASPQYVVPEEMVKKMKKGSIIIDLNVTQGGCFETSKCTTLSSPTFEKHGVIHYCVPNITARVSRTTTIALSNIFTSILLDISEIGGIQHYIKSNKGFREGIYIYNGILTNKDVGNKFRIPPKDLELLLAAF